MKKVQGFTLIELVIVIVILGILSAVALPRFINVVTDAQDANLDGLVGGLNSAVAVARAQYMIDGDMTSTTISMMGQNVTVIADDGKPTADAAGIQVALQSTNGYAVTHAATPNVTTFTPDGFGNGTCNVTYTESTAAVAKVDGGC